VPLIVLACLEDRAAGHQGIRRQAEPHLREVPLELSGQPEKGLQLAVPLAPLDPRLGRTVEVPVVDELAAHREGQARLGDQLGLKESFGFRLEPLASP
jgi:hypothetical protein